MKLKCKSFAWGGIYILSSRSVLCMFWRYPRWCKQPISFRVKTLQNNQVPFPPIYYAKHWMLGCCSTAVSPKAIQSPCRRNKRDLDVKAMRKVCCTCALCIFPYYVFISSVFIILRVKQLQYSILRYARTNAVYVEEVGGVSGETERLNMVSRVNTILFLSQVFL